MVPVADRRTTRVHIGRWDELAVVQRGATAVDPMLDVMALGSSTSGPICHPGPVRSDRRRDARTPPDYRVARPTDCRQNRMAHRCQGVSEPPAPATGRLAARTRAVQPRRHRQRPTRRSWTVPDTPVHGSTRHEDPDYPSRCGPGPPSPAPPEDRRPPRPAPAAPTWRTAAPRDRPRPGRPAPGSTPSARQRSWRPRGSRSTVQAARRSTIHTTPDQHPALMRVRRLLPPESKPQRLPDSTRWRCGRRARETCTQPPAPRPHRSPPTSDSTMPGPAPTHLRKIQTTMASPHGRNALFPRAEHIPHQGICSGSWTHSANRRSWSLLL